MFGTLAKLGLASALIAGGTLAMSVPAEAAPKKPKAKCAIGKWTLTSQKSTTTFEKDQVALTSVVTGGQGTKLTIGKTGSTYDFNKSKDVKAKGPEQEYIGRYRKTLKIKSKFTGDKKGLFASNPKSATGSATLKSTQTKPEQKDLGTVALAGAIKEGLPVELVVSLSKDTCSAKYLTFADTASGTEDGLKITFSSKLVFRRG